MPSEPSSLWPLRENEATVDLHLRQDRPSYNNTTPAEHKIDAGDDQCPVNRFRGGA